MILILQKNTTHPEADALQNRLISMGLHAVKEATQGRISIAIISSIDKNIDTAAFKSLPNVEAIEQFSQKYKLAGKDFHKQKLVIDIKGATIGGEELAVIAGPCSIENEAQIFKIAAAVKAAGGKFLRGGAFKPRTSPYEFQGLGEQGLQFIQKAAAQHNLVGVVEVMDEAQAEIAANYVDILQIGARNMQNFTLLKALGIYQQPILLKRGFHATYNEFLLAAEYILSAGNPHVILCERGIRTFESYTRNTLDLAAIPVLQELSHLPVIADPSHGTGIRSLVTPMAKAAVAAGADGIMVEIHYDPDNSYSDAQQTIGFEPFQKMMTAVQSIRSMVVN